MNHDQAISEIDPSLWPCNRHCGHFHGWKSDFDHSPFGVCSGASAREETSTQEGERIKTYVSAVENARLTFEQNNSLARAEPLAVELLRQLSESGRWDARLYVLSKMEMKPALNRPYYDGLVIERLSKDPNQAVRKKASQLLSAGSGDDAADQ